MVAVIAFLISCYPNCYGTSPRNTLQLEGSLNGVEKTNQSLSYRKQAASFFISTLIFVATCFGRSCPSSGEESESSHYGQDW
jgi:hypothetical protein